MKLSSFVAIKDMTLDLSEYVEDGEDSTLHVTVDKNSVTPAMMRRIEEDSENADLVVETILNTVKKWDLMGENKKPIPLTSDAVSEIGTYFLFELLSKIAEGINAEADEEGKASAAAS